MDFSGVNRTRALVASFAALLLSVASSNALAASEDVVKRQPLESLHGTVLTAYNVNPAISPEELSYLSSEVWAKGDFTRYESFDNGTSVIGIQHGELMYSFVEGEPQGVLLRLRGGIGALGLIRQFELVKSRGENAGTDIVDGVPCEKYVFEDEVTGEQIWALLSQETSIPIVWIGRLPNGNVTYVFYKDMEANVRIPDEMFEIPAEIDFSGNPPSLDGSVRDGAPESDAAQYEREFAREVSRFANLNRIHLSRLNRDVHANCYILITVATTINRDGTVGEISIVESSSVPVVDRYYRYVIEQAAPYPPLEDYFEPVPQETTVTSTFKLDTRLWGSGLRSTRECDKLEPGNSQPN
jgi:TonB family protein